MSNTSLDAAMFEVLHEALDAKGGHERRAGERHAYDCEQLMAPYNGVEMPNQTAFRHVSCRDLSLNGFSFVTEERPAYEFLVVALGAVPFKFVVARVQHVSDSDERPGQQKVGCRFVRRLA